MLRAALVKTINWSIPELPKKRRRPKHKKFQLKELTVLVPADAGPVETIIDQILQGEQNGREIRTKDGRLVAYVDGIVQRFNKKAHEAHQKKLKRRGKMPKGKSSSTKRLEGENSYPHGSTHTMTTSQEYYTFGTQKYPLQTKEETSKQQYDQMPLMMNSQHQAPESKLSSTEFHNAKKPPKPLFDPQLKNIGDHEKLLIPPKKYENIEFGKEEKDKTDNAMITKESYKSNNVSVYDGTKPNMVRIIKKDSIPELTWKNDLDIHLENLEGFMMNQFVEYSEPEEKDVTGSAEFGQFSPKEDMENNLDPNMERKDVPANQSEYLIKKPQYDSENVLRREHQVQQLNNKRINIQSKMSAKQMFSKHNENLVDIHELDQDQNVEYLSTSPKLNEGSASATISSEEKVTSSFLGSYGPKPNIKKIYLDRVETKSMNENREYEGSDESKDPDKEAESLENPNETDKDIVTIPVNVNALPHIEKVQTQNKQKEKTTLTETLPENDIVDVSNIREHPPLIPAKDKGYFKEERGRLTYKNVQSENKPMYFSKSDGNHNNTKIELSDIKLQMPGKIKSPIAHQFGKASQSINTFLDNDKENYKFKKSTLTNPGLHKTLTSYKNKHKRTMLPQPSRWEDDSSPDYKKSSHSLEKEELSTEELDKHQNIELVELQNLIQEPEYENSQNANHIGTDEQFLHKENKYDNTLSSFGRPSTHELNTNMVSKYSSRADTHIPEIFHTGDSSGPKGRETQLIRELAQYPKKAIGGKGTKISEKGKLLFNSYDKDSFDHNFAAPGFKGQIEAMQDKFETTPLSEERYDKSDGMALQSQAAIDSSDGYSKPSQVDFTARSKGTQWPTKLVNLESHIDDFESESASSESLEKKPREQVKKKQRESDIEDEQTNETTELQNFVHAHNIREYNNDEKTIEHNTKIKTTHEDIYSNKKHIGNKVPVIIWAQKSIETVEPKKTYVDVIPKEDIFDKNINVNELKVKQDEGKARIPVNIFYKNKPKSNAGTKTLSKIYEPYNGDKLQASYKHKEIEDKVAKTHKNEYSLANYTTVNINKNEPKQNAVVKESESIESVESKKNYNEPIILTKQYISKKTDSSELTETNTRHKILYNNDNNGISGIKTEYTRRFMPISPFSYSEEVKYRSEGENTKIITNKKDAGNGLDIKPEPIIKYKKEDKEFYGIKTDFVRRLLPSESDILENNYGSKIVNRNEGEVNAEFNKDTIISPENVGGGSDVEKTPKTSIYPQILYNNENDGISGVKTEYTRRLMPSSSLSGKEEVKYRNESENRIISKAMDGENESDTTPEPIIKYKKENKGFSIVKTDFVRRLLPSDIDTLENKDKSTIADRNYSESNIVTKVFPENEIGASDSKLTPKTNIKPQIFYNSENNGLSGVKTEYTRRLMPMPASSENEEVSMKSDNKTRRKLSKETDEGNEIKIKTKSLIKYKKEDRGFSGIKTDFVRRLLPFESDVLEQKDKYKNADKNGEERYSEAKMGTNVIPENEGSARKVKPYSQADTRPNIVYNNENDVISGVKTEYTRRMQITQENIPAEEIIDNIPCVSNDKSDEKPQVLHKIKFSENSTEQDFNETPDLISTEKLMQEKQENDKECEENINKIKTMSSNNEIVNTNEDKFSEIKVLNSPQTSYSDEKNGFVGTKNNHVKRLMTKGEDEQKMYDNDVEENINDINTKNGAQFSPQLKEETPDVHVVIAAQRMQSIQEGQSYNSNIFETRNKQKETFSTKDVSGDGAEYIEELAVPRHKSKGKNAQRGKMVIPKQVTNNTYITKQNRYNSESGISAVKSDYLQELEPYKNKIVSDSSKNELFRSKLDKYDVALEDQDLFMPSASSYESLYKRNGAITNKHNIQNNRLKNISSHKEVANRILFNEYKNNINSANTIDIILPTTQLKNSYTISGKLNYDNITFRYKTGTEDETKGDLLHPVDNSKMLFKPITVRMLQAENNNSLWVNMNVTNDAEMKQRLRNDNGTIVSTVQSNTTEEPNHKINTHTPLVKVVPLEEKVNTSFVNEGTTDKAVPSIPKTDFETERSTKEQINMTKNNHTAKGVTNSTVNKTEIKPSTTHIVKNEAIKSAQVSDQTTYMESKSPQQNVTLSLNIGDIERHLKLSRPTKYTFFREETIRPSLDEYNSTREENANNRHFSPNDKNPKMQGVVDAELSGKPLASLHEEQDNYEAPKPFKLFGTEDKIVAHIIKDTEAVRIDDLVIPIKSAYKQDIYLQNPVQLKDKANNTLYRHEFTDNVTNEQLNVLPNNFSDNNTQETITHETDNSVKNEVSMISETEPTVHPKQRFHPNEFDSNEDSSSEKYKVKSSKEEESEISGGDQFPNKVDKDEEDLPGVLMPDSKNVLKLKIIRVPPSALKGSHIKDVQGQNLGAPINLHVKLPRDEKMGRYLTLPEALKRGVLKVIGGKGQTGGLGPLSDVPVVFKHWNRMLDDPTDKKKKKIKKRGHKQRNQQRRRIAVRQSL
ncbi:unnamed protein product [Timema podura]|uniref:Uncharacterized protein n=1 Tax=Timema podura TaxID=61482 RepID=A0ABN7P1R6_TIMPD|nr:unnamed protein product [Timema podura]